MKNLRSFLCLLCVATSLAHGDSAPIGDVVVISKQQRFTQIDDGTPYQNDDFDRYRFEASVQTFGSADLSGLTAPTITLASGSTAATAAPTIYNNGTLVYNAGDGQWSYGAPNGTGHNAGTNPTNFNTLYANGVYTVTSEGYTYNLDLNGGSNNWAYFPTTIPQFTLTGGYWDNGTYYVDPANAFSIISNVFADYANASDNIGAFVGFWASGDLEFDVLNFSRLAPTGETAEAAGGTNGTIVGEQAGPKEITPGLQLRFGLEYGRMVSIDSSNNNGVTALALWSSQTELNLVVIPEPSTYALLALGLGVVGLAVRRRSHTAA